MKGGRGEGQGGVREEGENKGVFAIPVGTAPMELRESRGKRRLLSEEDSPKGLLILPRRKFCGSTGVRHRLQSP